MTGQNIAATDTGTAIYGMTDKLPATGIVSLYATGLSGQQVLLLGTSPGAINAESTAPAANSPPWTIAMLAATIVVLLSAVYTNRQQIFGGAFVRRHPLKLLIEAAITRIKPTVLAHAEKVLTGRRSDVAPFQHKRSLVSAITDAVFGVASQRQAHGGI
jgi:hypothetical protein